jgi:hypothetical protein
MRIWLTGYVVQECVKPGSPVMMLLELFSVSPFLAATMACVAIFQLPYAANIDSID